MIWGWEWGCGCCDNEEKSTQQKHLYQNCEHQDNLFWADRFSESGRTIKMPLQQDEISQVTATLILYVNTDTLELLNDTVNLMLDEVGDVGKAFYDLHFEQTQKSERLSVLEEHQYFTKTRQLYLEHALTPPIYEEIQLTIGVVNLAKHFIEKALLRNEEDPWVEVKVGYIPHEQTIETEYLLKIGEDVELTDVELLDHVTPETPRVKATTDVPA